MDKFVIRSRKTFGDCPSELSETNGGPSDSEGRHGKNKEKSIISAAIRGESVSVSCSTPSDISGIGEDILRKRVSRYPKNSQNRSFQPEWFQRFKWIEYSENADSVFCYPCRQFNPTGIKENAFVTSGFSNWRAALSQGKGFKKHEVSESHILASTMWMEKQRRIDLKKSVSTMINEDVLEKNRYYVKTIAEIIQFLAINELPFRGTWDLEENSESSLFRNLFEFTMKKDQKLGEIIKTIPTVATYLSPEIQNDTIEILAEMVKESIIKDVLSADVPFFSILVDGTKDKNNRENIAIGIRFVKDGKAHESILTIQTSLNYDAKTMCNLILNIIKESGLDSTKIISQCYDGAAVMSGDKGGVQALLQKYIDKRIPYVHCFNHRLHLVIVKSINEVHEVKDFFEQCSTLYAFLKRGTISKLYEGQPLARLLEQRWSGHLEVTKIIFNNFQKIVDALEKVRESKKCCGDYKAEGVGWLHTLKSFDFRFCLILMKNVLEIIQPADKILQARETSLSDSLLIVKSVTNILENFKSDETFTDTITKASELCVNEDENRNKRKRKRSIKMHDFLITDNIGERSDVDNDINMHLKNIFNSIMDNMLTEIKRRFTNNEILLNEIAAVEEFYSLKVENLQFLKSLGVKIPSAEEIAVVKKYLTNREKPTGREMFEEIAKQKVAFGDTYDLFAASRAFPCSTALCESTFSVLTRLNRPQRQSMSHQRLANLILLGFEKQRTKNVDLNMFLRNFNDKKRRRLQLF